MPDEIPARRSARAGHLVRARATKRPPYVDLSKHVQFSQRSRYPELGYSGCRNIDTGVLMELAALKSLRSPAHVRLLELLVAAREKAGLTQQQLADRLRKPQSFISKYEGGERRIDVIEFIAIAEALQMDASRAIREIRAKYRA